MRTRKSTKRQTQKSKQSHRGKIIPDVVISDDSPEPLSPPKRSVSPLLTDAFRRKFPWFKRFPHISSESFSSDSEDSYEPTSRPESRNFESPISVTLLATKFRSPRREALPPSSGPKENLEPSKMSEDS